MSQVICPSCGRAGATVRELAEYNYRECGLTGVKLLGGVTETSCSGCRKKHIRIRKEGQLLQVIALKLLTTRPRLTGPEMRFLRKTCELSQADLAAKLGQRRATVAEREAKDDPNLSQAEQIGLRVILLNAFCEHLAREGRNLLAKSHMERLEAFARKLVQLIENVEAARAKRMRVELQEDWQLDEAA